MAEKKRLLKIWTWLKNSLKPGDEFPAPPYPGNTWSEFPEDMWPSGYTPLHDKDYTKINSKGELS
jgi:hypothetical protein